MGLFDKVKNILFDEEEVEIPVIKKEPKKEIKEIEEENPIKEIKIPKDDFSDKENFKSESTFTFPIDFEDEEVIEKEEEKPVFNDYKPIKKQEKRDYSDFLTRKDEKKHFKPTPIISPVYGILDQNYKKEDVIVKKDILRRPSELSLEEVRKKAFGSLEDEIDANLVNDTDTNIIKTKEEIKIKKEKVIEKKLIEKVEEPVDKLKTIGELIEEDSLTIDVPEIEEKLEDTIELDSIKINKIEDNIKEEDLVEEPTNTIEDLLDNSSTVDETEELDEIDEEEEDLFSLIDSMYEEKGE